MQQLAQWQQQDGQLQLSGVDGLELAQLTAEFRRLATLTGETTPGVEYGADRLQCRFTFKQQAFIFYHEALCDACWIEPASQAAQKLLPQLHKTLQRHAILSQSRDINADAGGF